MNRKINFPVSVSEIKYPDSNKIPHDTNTNVVCNNESDELSESRKKQLIKLANDVWGIDGWNFSVTNQHIDFVDFFNGLYHVGAVSFIKLQLKNGTYREDIGYATMQASQKGLAIFRARKCSVTNALMEILSNIGGRISELLNELLSQEKATQVQTSENNENCKNNINQTSSVSDLTRNNSLPRSEKILKSNNAVDVTKTAGIELSDKGSDVQELIQTFSAYQIPNKQLSPNILAPKLPTRIDNNISPPPTLNQNILKSLNTEINQNVEDSRAERLRRQKMKQEEFKKQLQHMATKSN